MQLEQSARALFAETVPYYVRYEAEVERYNVHRTADDECVGHAGTAKLAVFEALDRAELGGDPVARDDGKPSGMVKEPVLHGDDGEPDGVWRALDASAVEDEPIDGARISERTIWELAESLNTSPKAKAVNGGPSSGFAASLPHGDAFEGGGHPANGWAHVGVPVIKASGRTHLYLFAELTAEVAKEVDRGRLAFGSVYFGMERIDEEDNFAALGAALISHALTNDPAVETLSPGSARARNHNGRVLRTFRSPWRHNTMDTNTDNAGREAEATERDGEAAARMLMGAEAEAFAEEVSGMLGVIFGKPDAAPMDLLAELEASSELLAQAMAEPGEDGAEEDAEAEAEEAPEEEPEEERAADEDPRAEDEEEMRSKLRLYESRDWVEAELVSQNKSASREKRDRWASLVAESGNAGRALVTELIGALSVPPAAPPSAFRSSEVQPGADQSEPKTFSEAVDACEAAAREALEAEEKKKATALRRAAMPIPSHIVRARAQRIARERFPQITNSRGA